MALWAIGIVFTANLLPDIASKLATALGDTGTYDGRMSGWSNLLNDFFSGAETNIIFGAPMGNGFGRLEGMNWVAYAPHNWYLTVFLRGGIVGLASLILFLVAVLSKAVVARANTAAVAMLIALVVYGWSYSWPWYVCIFAGWAIATRGSDQETDRKSVV